MEKSIALQWRMKSEVVLHESGNHPPRSLVGIARSRSGRGRRGGRAIEQGRGRRGKKERQGKKACV